MIRVDLHAEWARPEAVGIDQSICIAFSQSMSYFVPSQNLNGLSKIPTSHLHNHLVKRRQLIGV